MQTLGVSDAPPPSESRLKSLFWPSIRSGSDVDYLSIQGYWVCTFVAVMTFALGLLGVGMARNGIQAVFLALFATMMFLFFYLGGVGVREGSRFAAAVVFLFYGLDTAVAFLQMLSASGVAGPMVVPGSVVMILVKTAITVVLFCNLRATWIAAKWVPGAEEAALPPRRSETFTDRFVDQWPRAIWSVLRIPYYVFAAAVSFLMFSGYLVILFRALLLRAAR